MQVGQLAIIGLDCAAPALVFDQWLEDLPNLRSLVRHGLYGRLQSCMPPTTVPAWSCMASGKDPGALGIYGFTDRRDWTYESPGLVTNLEVRQPRLWDRVARTGHESILLGIPQTFPILRPPTGCCVTGMLTPSLETPYTYPPELAAELTAACGPYIIDVEDYRSDDKPALLERIRVMTAQRFALARHLVTTRPWQLFWMVDLGPDRMHHAFWHFMDRNHERYVRNSPLGAAIHDYYVELDREIGTLLECFARDNTAVWVTSDHGAQRLDGAFCLNDWLRQQGLLRLKSDPVAPRRFDLADVDWQRTRAWADGGYYGRIYINRRGREPRGQVPDDQYEPLREDLVRRLEQLETPAGRRLENRVVRPDELFEVANGFPPDLLLLVDDLRYRCVSRVGHSELFLHGDAAGPETGTHALDGLHILAHPQLASRRCDASLYDVMPTALHLLGHDVPRGLPGRVLVD